jgi:hypothetical protein
MTPQQIAFAHHYSAHHRADQAAREAGYSPARCRQTGSELLRRPDVRALVIELDDRKRVLAGVDAAWIVAGLKEYAEGGLSGKYPPGVGVRALEALARVSGLFVDRSTVEHTGEVVYTLMLDRTLEGGNTE